MARKTSGTRARSKSSTHPRSNTPTNLNNKNDNSNLKQNAHIYQPTQPSFMGSVTQGVGLGTGMAIGSSIAHGVADKIFGSNDNLKNSDSENTNTLTNQNQNQNIGISQVSDNSNNNFNCLFEQDNLKKCLQTNDNNIDNCYNYLEFLNICRKNIVM